MSLDDYRKRVIRMLEQRDDIDEHDKRVAALAINAAVKTADADPAKRARIRAALEAAAVEKTSTRKAADDFFVRRQVAGDRARTKARLALEVAWDLVERGESSRELLAKETSFPSGLCGVQLSGGELCHLPDMHELKIHLPRAMLACKCGVEILPFSDCSHGTTMTIVSPSLGRRHERDECVDVQIDTARELRRGALSDAYDYSLAEANRKERAAKRPTRKRVTRRKKRGKS